MNKRKVILRADGNSDIGMGHFIRTLALGEMLKDYFSCIYATRTPSRYQKQEINEVCEDIIELPMNNNHFDLFLEYLEGNEIVVLDNYYFDTEYQKRIKDKGCKLVCIDDIHDKHYVADIVINHAEGLTSNLFSIEDYTKLCLGFKYALLRKPFYENNSHNGNKKFDVMIGIGGTDPYDLTNVMIKNIQQIESDSIIAVLTGNSYRGKVKESNTSKIEVFKGLSANDVSLLMTNSKIGIFPASTIAIEAIAMRIPFLVGYFVDNQIEIFNGIIKNGLGVELGDLNNYEMLRISEKISQFNNNSSLLKSIIENQKQILDKKSPERLKKTFNFLI